MRNQICCFFALFLSLTLFLCLPVLAAAYAFDAPAQEQGAEWQTEENIVYDEAEFLEWCYAHSKSGGIVYLGAVITLTERFSLFNSEYIIIDTGEFGFIYDGSFVNISKCEIIGEGVDVPVVSIYDPNCFRNSWEDSVLGKKITATGRGGVGGTVVCVYAESSYSFNSSCSYDYGLISSYGSGAIGLYVDTPMDMHFLNIYVEGDNSTGVYAPKGANLYYCKINASGAGAVAVSGDSIFLDTCATFPAAEGVNAINRQIIGVSGSGFYIPISQGDSRSYWSYITGYYTLLLSGSDGYPPTTLFTSVDWDEDALEKIDVETLGLTSIKGQLNSTLQGLGLEDGSFPLELILEVHPPELPCIYRYWLSYDYEEDAVNRIVLYFEDSCNPEDDDIIFWFSDDEGATWHDYTDFESMDWWSSGLSFYYGEIIDSIWLKIEVPNKGESNIVSISMKDGMAVFGNGGDRTGTDRNTGLNNRNTGDNLDPEINPNNVGNTDLEIGENSSGGDHTETEAESYGSGRTETETENYGSNRTGAQLNGDGNDRDSTQQDSYPTIHVIFSAYNSLFANTLNAVSEVGQLLNIVQAEVVSANTGDSPEIAEMPVAAVKSEDTLASIDIYDTLDTLPAVDEARHPEINQQQELLKNINTAMSIAAGAFVLLTIAFVLVRLRMVKGK